MSDTNFIKNNSPVLLHSLGKKINKKCRNVFNSKLLAYWTVNPNRIGSLKFIDLQNDYDHSDNMLNLRFTGVGILYPVFLYIRPNKFVSNRIFLTTSKKTFYFPRGWVLFKIISLQFLFGFNSKVIQPFNISKANRMCFLNSLLDKIIKYIMIT